MPGANWNTEITTNNANMEAGVVADSVTVPAEVSIADWSANLEAGNVNLFSPFALQEQNFIVSMEVGADVYSGATTIIPANVEQEFETKNKICRQNLLVEKIPYSATENLSGGYTVSIG